MNILDGKMKFTLDFYCAIAILLSTDEQHFQNVHLTLINRQKFDSSTGFCSLFFRIPCMTPLSKCQMQTWKKKTRENIQNTYFSIQNIPFANEFSKKIEFLSMINCLVLIDEIFFPQVQTVCVTTSAKYETEMMPFDCACSLFCQSMYQFSCAPIYHQHIHTVRHCGAER